MYFHVDLDAFYASVEQRDNPEYRDRPVVVGALPGNRGVVAACSYEARAFGIHSAMPISDAYRRCPDAVYLRPRMRDYVCESNRIMETLRRFSPIVRQISVDEAFLDMRGTERLLGPPETVARELKGQIRERHGLALSIGVATNRYVAKIASAHGKPDGLFVVPQGDEEAFLRGLPLTKLWGAGKVLRRRLESRGISSIEELQQRDKKWLTAVFGPSAGAFLFRASRGIDPGIYPDEPKSRSISNETTFGEDTDSREEIRRAILWLCDTLTFRLLEEDLYATTLTIKVRDANFDTTSVRKTFSRGLRTTEELYARSLELLDRRWDGKIPLRLVGVGLSNFVSSREPELFVDESEERHDRVEDAVHRVNSRLGNGTLRRARLLPRGRRDETTAPD
ncbi:MAG: DNA polymerase IV [Spirochaetaceae bacterium]